MHPLSTSSIWTMPERARGVRSCYCYTTWQRRLVQAKAQELLKDFESPASFREIGKGRKVNFRQFCITVWSAMLSRSFWVNRWLLYSHISPTTNSSVLALTHLGRFRCWTSFLTLITVFYSLCPSNGIKWEQQTHGIGRNDHNKLNPST